MESAVPQQPDGSHTHSLELDAHSLEPDTHSLELDAHSLELDDSRRIQQRRCFGAWLPSRTASCCSATKHHTVRMTHPTGSSLPEGKRHSRHQVKQS